MFCILEGERISGRIVLYIEYWISCTVSSLLLYSFNLYERRGHSMQQYKVPSQTPWLTLTALVIIVQPQSFQLQSHILKVLKLKSSLLNLRPGPARPFFPGSRIPFTSCAGVKAYHGRGYKAEAY
jgi:hypothetical protein